LGFWIKKVRKLEMTQERNVRKCKVCGKAIGKQDSEDFEDLCWEMRDDKLTPRIRYHVR